VLPRDKLRRCNIAAQFAMSRSPYIRHIALAPSLAALTASVMLILTLATMELVGYTLTKQTKADIGRNLAELAFQTTDKLDRGMYERYREVKLMAERHEVTNPNVPLAAKRAVLESMQATHPFYAWIGLTDNQGEVKIATHGLLEGKNVAARPWFAGAYQAVYLHDVHEAVLLAKLLPNPTGEPKRFFDIAFPFRDATGAIAGVFGTHLSWQWAADVQRSVLRPLAERKAVDTLILSKNGVVLLGPKAYKDQVLKQQSIARAEQEKNGSLIETWPDGKRYLVGFSQSRGHESYPGLGWIVVVRQPLDEAFKPVEDLRSKILWIGLCAAALVSFLIWVFARNITRPLATITKHADALRAGLVKEIPPIPSRLTEVQILQGALNSLLAKLLKNEHGLRELNATLETRVVERTAELHAAVEQTRKGEQRVKAIIDTALDAFVGVDAGGKITDWNPRAEEIFGWTRAEVLGKTVTETIVPFSFRNAHESGMKRFSTSGSSGVVGKRLLLSAMRRDGSEFPVEMTIGLINAGDSHFFGTFIQDISERKKIEDDLARERELLNAILDSIDVGVLVCSSGGDVSLFNRAAKEIHGEAAVPDTHAAATPSYQLFLADGVTPMSLDQAPLLRALRGELIENAELVVKPAGDAPRFLLASGRALHGKEGGNIGAVIALKDISAIKRHQEELNKLARVDALTGLPNRRAYYEQLEAATRRAQRSSKGVGLMFLDVDHFKQVNDSLGHAAGDIVLHEFAQRVKKAVRATDTACRLAGDEFTVILEGLKSPDEAALVAAKILRSFETPFMLDQGERLVSTSVGVAYADAFPVDTAELESAADKALYLAKSRGRRQFAISRLT
jgi:diguanylate cyclase (GGDEF)-like protein/PAS domain S-box-containing protein